MSAQTPSSVSGSNHAPDPSLFIGTKFADLVTAPEWRNAFANGASPHLKDDAEVLLDTTPTAEQLAIAPRPIKAHLVLCSAPGGYTVCEMHYRPAGDAVSDIKPPSFESLTNIVASHLISEAERRAVAAASTRMITFCPSNRFWMQAYHLLKKKKAGYHGFILPWDTRLLYEGPALDSVNGTIRTSAPARVVVLQRPGEHTMFTLSQNTDPKCTVPTHEMPWISDADNLEDIPQLTAHQKTAIANVQLHVTRIADLTDVTP